MDQAQGCNRQSRNLFIFSKKTALTADLLAKALRRIPEDLAGLRDRALILIGFADHAAHKLDTTRGYVQVADAFRDHSGKGLL